MNDAFEAVALDDEAPRWRVALPEGWRRVDSETVGRTLRAMAVAEDAPDAFERPVRAIAMAARTSHVDALLLPPSASPLPLAIVARAVRPRVGGLVDAVRGLIDAVDAEPIDPARRLLRWHTSERLPGAHFVVVGVQHVMTPIPDGAHATALAFSAITITRDDPAGAEQRRSLDDGAERIVRSLQWRASPDSSSTAS